MNLHLHWGEVFWYNAAWKFREVRLGDQEGLQKSARAEVLWMR